MYFLALSQAPPEFAIEIANNIPTTSAPASKPPSASAPKKIPTTIGETIAITPGSIIPLNDALVAISTHAA